MNGPFWRHPDSKFRECTRINAYEDGIAQDYS